MDSIIASTILSLSTNIDNFTIGFAYSLKRLHITFPANLVIAILSGISTYTSMSVGDWIHKFLAPDVSHNLGSMVLIIIGIFTIVEIIKNKWRAENSSELQMNSVAQNLINHPGRVMNYQEALLIGLALTITNLATGIGAGIAELNLWLTSSLSFGSSLLTIAGGWWLGKVFTRSFSGHKLEIIAGFLLIVLGVYEYLG